VRASRWRRSDTPSDCDADEHARHHRSGGQPRARREPRSKLPDVTNSRPPRGIRWRSTARGHDRRAPRPPGLARAKAVPIVVLGTLGPRAICSLRHPQHETWPRSSRAWSYPCDDAATSRVWRALHLRAQGGRGLPNRDTARSDGAVFPTAGNEATAASVAPLPATATALRVRATRRSGTGRWPGDRSVMNGSPHATTDFGLAVLAGCAAFTIFLWVGGVRCRWCAGTA
jgi:hypothetical protein